MHRLTLASLVLLCNCGGSPLYLNEQLDGGASDGSPKVTTPDASTTVPTTVSCTKSVAPTRMPVAFFLGGAATGSDGLIYVLEGAEHVESNNGTKAFTYNPTTGAWAQIADMPAALTGIVNAVSVNDSIYTVADKTFAYDIISKNWSTKTARLPASINMSAAVGSDGKIYVAGGDTVSPPANTTPATYDPASDTWLSLADAPYESDEQLAAFLDGNFYFFGSGNAAFDLTTRAWSQLPSPPTPRFIGAGGAVNGKLIIAGGMNANTSVNTAVVEAYDPASATWSTRAPMPLQVVEAASAVGCDGKLYVFGGDASGLVTNAVQAYDPIADSWQLSP